MSIGLAERRTSYDDLHAPIVKFSRSNYIDKLDDDGITDDSMSSNVTCDTLSNIILDKRERKLLH